MVGVREILKIEAIKLALFWANLRHLVSKVDGKYLLICSAGCYLQGRGLLGDS